MIERTCADRVLAIGNHEGGCVSILEVFGGTPDLPFSIDLRGTKGKLIIIGDGASSFETGHLLVSTMTVPSPSPALL